jgi:2-polyprenyl-3-methyl-5-hydroxy-6-metoxy-1,4-benzoquinol methylase
MTSPAKAKPNLSDGWKQKWYKATQKPEKFHCHICQKETNHKLVLGLVNEDTTRHSQKVYSCLICKIVVIVGEKRNYPADDKDINASLYNMPGLGVMNLSAALAEKYGAKSFLDVGADFGFATDIAKHGYGLDAEGLEPTNARLRAKKHFRAKVTEGYMTPDTDLGKKFDYIHSSEVLEHVPDPLEFLQALHGNLTKNGLLFMTTPWAGVLSPKNSSGLLISNLSPEDHIYLWNETAVTKLLKQVGFKKIYVEVQDGHHVYILASKSLPKKKLDLTIPDTSDKKLAYMLKRSKTAKSRIARLSMLAAAFFMANEQRNYELCVKLLPRLLKLSKRMFGINLSNPTRVKSSDFTKLGGYAPRIAALCYVISTVHILHTADYDKAVAYCELALKIIDNKKASAGYSDYVSTLRGAVIDTLEVAKQHKKASVEATKA